MIMFQLFLTLNLVRNQYDLAEMITTQPSTKTAVKSFIIHLRIRLVEGMVSSFLCLYNFLYISDISHGSVSDIRPCIIIHKPLWFTYLVT